jgi:hypothetical protein
MLPPEKAGPAICDLKQTRPTGNGAKPGLGDAIHTVTLSDRRGPGERAPTRRSARLAGLRSLPLRQRLNVHSECGVTRWSLLTGSPPDVLVSLLCPGSEYQWWLTRPPGLPSPTGGAMRRPFTLTRYGNRELTAQAGPVPRPRADVEGAAERGQPVSYPLQAGAKPTARGVEPGPVVGHGEPVLLAAQGYHLEERRRAWTRSPGRHRLTAGSANARTSWPHSAEAIMRSRPLCWTCRPKCETISGLRAVSFADLQHSR